MMQSIHPRIRLADDSPSRVSQLSSGYARNPDHISAVSPSGTLWECLNNISKAEVFKISAFLPFL